MWILGLKGLRSNEGDDNGNTTKAIGLIKKNNNFARASRFFVHFFAITARLRCENALILRCAEEVHKRRRSFLPLSELGYGS